MTAVALLGRAGALPYVVSAIAFMALMGWFRAPNLEQERLVAPLAARDAMEIGVYLDFAHEALQRFGGLAFGLLSMSTVAAWSITGGQRWTPIFGQVVKVESRSDRRNLECHARDGATRLS